MAVEGQIELIDSATAAEQIGISYPRLTRLVREGMIAATYYSGQQRTPIGWTESDINRARAVVVLIDLGLDDHEIHFLTDYLREVFEQGFTPAWINPIMKDGRSIGDAICVHPSQWEIQGDRRPALKVGNIQVYEGKILFIPLPDGWDKKRRSRG